jgi:hypothetical protein
MTKSIHDVAMLSRLSFTAFSASVVDKKATKDILAKNNASAKSGKFRKVIIPPEVFDKADKIRNKIKTYYESKTLLWNPGLRILPSSLYKEVTDTLRAGIIELESAWDELQTTLPAAIQHAQSTLNGLYDPNDYPSYQEIRNQFSVTLDFYPLPNDSDFRVNMSSDIIDSVRASVKASLEKSFEESTKRVWERLHKVTTAMTTVLSDNKAVFRDSLVGNVQELCDILPDLNLTGDTALEQARVEALKNLTQYSPETLRKDKIKRAEVAKASSKLADMASAYM